MIGGLVTMLTIFDFKSYKTYLLEICSQERGALTRLSEAAECQKSYLSLCLKGKNNITLDHAYGISEYLQLTSSEQQYFFLLLDKEKAGTVRLQRHLEAQLKGLSREAYRLKNQQKDTHIISEQMSELAFYYSNWMAMAIHTLTSIGDYQSVEALAERLKLTVSAVQILLTELEKAGLVTQHRGKYKWGSGNLHLADNSPWIATHHANWRLRAIDNCQRRDGEASHYTAIQSMSVEDFEVLKKKIAMFIKEFNKVSDPSEPEEAYCFSIDFFRV